MKADRRHFLRASAAAAAACSLRNIARADDSTGQNRLKEIGIIGGVPSEMGKDWQKSLRRMAEIGYTILESGPLGPSPDAFLRFLKDIGMKLVSCGAGFGKKLPPNWLDTAKALQAQYATVFWPWFYNAQTLTMPQLKEITEQLNEAGRQAKAAGLRLAVHNHDKEFRVLEGKPIFDHLLEMTRPELVAIEMDLYWAVKGGADPLDYFKRYPGRFELFHVKDMGPPPEWDFIAVGSGTIDFARIFAKSEQAGVKHYIVELEGRANTVKAAEESFRHLKQLRF